MKKSFLKMHGLGNDFAIFDGRRDGFGLSAAQIRAFGDRRTGIGYDQVVVISKPVTEGTDAFVRIYNVDGTEIPCGNATRCIAALLMAGLRKNEVSIENRFGTVHAWNENNEIAVDMGPARLEWSEIPLKSAADTLSLPVNENMLNNPVGVNMGNPHAVFFVDDVAAVPLEAVGPKIENHPLFPERTNVEVAEVLSKDKIRMRVWERGTGVTMACGTGACAVAVAGVRRGLTARKVTVVLDGGTLGIEWRESDGHVLMTGPATISYMGEIEL